MNDEWTVVLKKSKLRHWLAKLGKNERQEKKPQSLFPLLYLKQGEMERSVDLIWTVSHSQVSGKNFLSRSAGVLGLAADSSDRQW